MPIIPASKIAANTTPVPFDVTLTTAGTAEDLVAIPVNLRGRNVSLVNEGPGPVRIGFDHTATASDLLLEEGDAYSDVDITITTKISFVDAIGTRPRVRGVVWCGG